MFTKQQKTRIERIHEGHTFGASVVASENDHLANMLQPGNSPEMYSMGTRLLT